MPVFLKLENPAVHDLTGQAVDPDEMEDIIAADADLWSDLSRRGLAQSATSTTSEEGVEDRFSYFVHTSRENVAEKLRQVSNLYGISWWAVLGSNQ